MHALSLWNVTGFGGRSMHPLRGRADDERLVGEWKSMRCVPGSDILSCCTKVRRGGLNRVFDVHRARLFYR